MNSKSNSTLDSSRVATLERALAILSVFEASKTPVTLAQISQATGLYKSTILRLIASFEDHGYIQRSPDGMTYTVGPTAYRLGMTYKKSFELDKAVENTLEELVSKGTESASFHVIDRDHRMCVLRVDSNHPTLDRVAAGDRLPLDRGAAGKILRAFTGENTPEMQSVRDNGIAVSQGEVDPSCAAISVPVFGLSNELIGAISVSGPKERFTKESVESMSQLLVEASRKLSKLAVAERRVRTLPLRA